jgi:hypothetical protein
VSALCVVILAACSESGLPIADYCESPAVQAARIMLSYPPPSVTELRLAPWFGESQMPDTLMPSLLRATALRLVSEGELEGGDPYTAMLRLIGEEHIPPDTTAVSIEWARLGGGTNNEWQGQDFRVTFQCSDGCCRHVETRLSGD